MKSKSLFLLLLLSVFAAKAQNNASLVVQGKSDHTISRHIYGHFSEHLGRCIYDGFWVDPSLNVPKKDRIRLDVVEALKKIHVPNLRWPGGCFADEYHWRDGIGPRDQRPKMVNTNWGGVTEDNSFGTHEFLELCELLQCEPYVSANVGSGTVEEMAKWVEYLNFDGVSPMSKLRKENGHETPWKVSFWGVGNESWGCGGNMTPAFYADQYRRYATYARNYAGAPLKKIASGANDFDYNWTETCMKQIPLHMLWGLTLHYYTVPGNWGKKGSATSFSEKEYFTTMKKCLAMDPLVTKHSAIMDKYDPEKKVSLVVDEWGIWTDVEPGTNPGFLYQQNSLRDALIAGSTLNIFNNHSDRVRMANLAQTVNVLQAIILTDKEKMLLTPTYHVFDLYKVHMDAEYLPILVNSPKYKVEGEEIPAVNVSASRDSSGAVHISFVNLNPSQKITVTTQLQDVNWKGVTGQVLTSAKVTDVNTFEQPNKIHIEKFAGAKKQGDNLIVELPAESVVVLELK
ncbi:alpha-N-arabinofuranosidase [Chitinophaga tropicalis]|uniref:non-reducing end alpha-L-arabinofuranosidase n=1 Tax=Chitinophaga tropicalis TaxID=2683588 RepID=A0A7K1U8F2_9BACT|nr:alpha-L-arabinofuranosidase C-terminal domain-containing protein [Chitinophaga tropicalis]MVT10641.1 alpha-N-arabinofuranosidase [Chitinophaga tropicalis]